MERIARILVSIVCLSLLTVGVASSQEKDAKGCKDHPLISRMNNYYISCRKSHRCLQFFGKKVLDQFFLGGKPSDAFVGFDPVIVVDEPS